MPSPRAGGLPSYDIATSYAWPPEELLNTYLPQFSGILDAYWGRNRIHLHSEYMGVVILLLVVRLGAGLQVCYPLPGIGLQGVLRGLAQVSLLLIPLACPQVQGRNEFRILLFEAST